MHALMCQVGAIDRAHTVTGDGPKFQYRSVHDVVNAVSPIMADLGIMLGMESELTQYRVDVVNGFPGHELKLHGRKLVGTYLRVGLLPGNAWRTFNSKSQSAKDSASWFPRRCGRRPR